MSKTEKTHLELVREWLVENVQSFPTPQKIKLSNFEVDWEKLSGSFNLTLDGVFIKDRMSFGPETSGKPTLYYPMYHSPLGAPASYGMFNLTWETEYCILKQLKMLLPRLFGGEYCDLNRNKLDTVTLNKIRKKVTDPNLTLEFDMSYDFKI